MDSARLISIVDDDESIREALVGLMTALGFRARAFSSALEFLASPSLDETACLIADVNMPEMTGIEMHRRLLKHGRAIPTILITAYPNEADRARALADGIVGYLAKPFQEDILLEHVRAALRPAKSD